MHRWSNWQESWSKSLGRSWHWLRTAPHVEAWCIVLAVAIVLGCQALDFHEHLMPWMPSSGSEVPRDWIPPDRWTLFYDYLSPYLKVIALLAGFLFHVAVVRAQPDLKRLLLPTWLACAGLAAWLVLDDAFDQWQLLHGVMMGKPFSLWAYITKLVLLAVGALVPAAALTWYERCPIWERYLLRSIAEPLSFCFIAFCSLWVLLDLLDSLRDFQDSGVKPVRMLAFYCNMLPFVFVESAAPALLLASLHALLRLVKSNELVALQSAGLGTSTLLRPFWMTAALVCLLSAALNFDWAQRAEGERSTLLKGDSTAHKAAPLATSVMHYHPSTRRLWFVAFVPHNLRHEKLKGVEVRQFNEQGELQEAWSAGSAYRWANGLWSFSRGVHSRYEQGTLVPVEIFTPQYPRQQYDATGWPETLWDVISSTQSPELMGAPDLIATLASPGTLTEARSRLHFIAQAWHRVIFPWHAFALVFIVSLLPPLHARQGLLRSVGTGIGLYLGLMFFNSATLSIARSGRLPAPLALALPPLLLIVCGMILLARRNHYQWRWPTLPAGPWRQWWRLLRGRRTRPFRLQGEFYQLNAARSDEPHIRS